MTVARLADTDATVRVLFKTIGVAHIPVHLAHEGISLGANGLYNGRDGVGSSG
jgi:hypothetical protein